MTGDAGARVVLALFARGVFGNDTAPASELGEVTLHPHQQEAVQRIPRILWQFRGALLADDVGTGKTFTALAVAARMKARPLIIAPAILHDMWRRAAQQTSVPISLLSAESLGRRDPPPMEHDLLIVDEAHLFRNPATKRHRRLAVLTSAKPVLLISATPVHNSASDLSSVLSLFLGARAATMDDSLLASVVIRREQHSRQTAALVPPVVHAAAPLLPAQDDLLDAIVGLPPAVPPADGGDGGALVTWTLVRLWASSSAALVRGLQRRLALGSAMLVALENGERPRAAELRSWCASDEVIQLPLFGMRAATAADIAAIDAATLLQAVGAHLVALRKLLAAARAGAAAADDARSLAIDEIVRRHAGEKVIVFTQFAETARAMFTRSLRRGQTGMLTASGAAIASGRLPRRELVALFAPVANCAPVPQLSRRVDTLFCTDVLSEGSNLQDASVVVNLDVPWTPVRLAQRIGRVARTGSSASRVTVYSFSPPSSAGALLRMERRLAAKLSVASRTIGVSGVVLPMLHIAATRPLSPSEVEEGIRELLRAYLRDGPCARCASCAQEWRRSTGETAVLPTTATVPAGSERAFIALLRHPEGDSDHSGRGELIAGVDNLVREDRSQLARLLGIASEAAERTTSERVCAHHRSGAHEPADTRRADVLAALRAISEWHDARSARDVAGLPLAVYAHARRKLLRRIDAITTRAPVHRRPMLHRIAARARHVATAPYALGAERVLDELVSATMPDEAWLKAIESFGNAQGSRLSPASAAHPVVVALLLFRPAVNLR